MMISIHPYGDSALLVNFEQKIDRKIHEQVLALDKALSGTKGIGYMIPAYCSLVIAYDPDVISFLELQSQIAEVKEITSTNVAKQETQSRVHEILVCYDGGFGLDLDDVARQTGKSVEEIIRMHTNTEFYVYMLGFMPGFTYMGDMPEEYYCHRHKTPRTHVPPGSVGLAGLQTAVYPFESPGGWQIIGRTPMKLFDTTKAQAALLSAGDMVRFVRINEEKYSGMAQRAEKKAQGR